MNKITAGFAMCGSFCTMSRAAEQIEFLIGRGLEVIPIMSETARKTDTRFGASEDIVNSIESLCGRKIIASITEAEPIGPQKLLDILIVEPCTGNTLAKLAAGISDTSVTLAVKAHLRNDRPVLLAVSTNDALAGAASNIGRLLNSRNIYFVPMQQDDSEGKPRSVTADFTMTYDAVLAALEGRQLQPILL